MSATGSVYVIEDHAALRDSLSFLLASSGLTVQLFELGRSLPRSSAAPAQRMHTDRYPHARIRRH